ncbi:MAG: glycosyltransferase [Saprospiraceae bacterium]
MKHFSQNNAMPTSNPKPLRIAMVLDTFGDVRNGGVISTKRFTAMLREEGHRVTIISADNESEPDKVTLKSFYPPFFSRVMRQMNFVFAWPERQNILKAIQESDIVHVQMPFYLGIRAANLARKLSKPLVISFHVQAEQLLYNVGLKRQWLVHLVYRFFIKMLYNKADLVICPSHFADAEIRRYGLRAPTIVISNGVTSEYHVEAVLRKYPENFVILNVGRNAVEKRQDMLLRAVAKSRYCDRIKVIMVGHGPQRGALVRLSEEMLGGNVDFEYLPPSEVISAYNTSDLFVHCAAVEVECMTALEAMACGLPLLIADAPLSATKQFALSERHLFSTEEELTRKIDFWYENPEMLRQAKAQYLEFVKQYRIEASFKKLKEAYLAVMQK